MGCHCGRIIVPPIDCALCEEGGGATEWCRQWTYNFSDFRYVKFILTIKEG